MKTRLMTIFGVAAAAVVASLPASAHHSFSAEFDAQKKVTLNGRVTKMDWVNPHAWLYLDVEKDGKIEHWAVEFGSPNVLFRQGWKRDSLPEGTRVIVRGSAAKDGSLRANSSAVEFPDGRKLDTGSSQGKEK